MPSASSLRVSELRKPNRSRQNLLGALVERVERDHRGAYAARPDLADADRVAQDGLGVDVRFCRPYQPGDHDCALAGMTCHELLAVLRAELDLAHSQRLEGCHLALEEEDVGGNVRGVAQRLVLEPALSRLPGPTGRRAKSRDAGDQCLIGVDLLLREVDPFALSHGRVRLAFVLERPPCSPRLTRETR